MYKVTKPNQTEYTYSKIEWHLSWALIWLIGIATGLIFGLAWDNTHYCIIELIF